MKTTEPVELEGVVVAIAWGPSGEVVDVGLATVDETEHRIDPDIARAHSLRDFLRKRVRLSAVLRGDRVIQVKSVEVVAITELDAQPNQRS